MASHGSDGSLSVVYRSQRAYRRMIAFWGFITSNAHWVIWGFHADAYALILLECILLGMNARGFRKNLNASESST